MCAARHAVERKSDLPMASDSAIDNGLWWIGSFDLLLKEITSALLRRGSHVFFRNRSRAEKVIHNRKK